MVRDNYLVDAAQYYEGLPHQQKAWTELQQALGDHPALADFARQYQAASIPTTDFAAPGKESPEPVYQLRFLMATGRSSSLLTGKLEFLRDGKIYNEIICTSSLPGRQGFGAWNRKGGLIPPSTMVKERTGKNYRVKTTPVYLPNVTGVSGNFYPIEPFELETDGDVRGDWGIHFDANVPGSMGCIVAVTDKGWAATQRELKVLAGLGIRSIELIIEYT